jgi:hypothetical protein
VTAQALAEQIELRERLAAIVDELELLDADTDVPRTIAAGLLEDLDRLLAVPADRRDR